LPVRASGIASQHRFDRQGVHPIRRLELDRSPGAARIAREAVREEFAGRFPEEAIAAAELGASELVTNAVKYGTPGIILTVHDGDGYLHVEVEDRGSSFDLWARGSEGGFGLRVVSTLAEDWGQRSTDYGLLVWAKFPPDAPDK
jgi:anti-sigma regulatory factor (Ser/Thr protein kinase)